MSKIAIGNRIKSLREDRGLTQKQLAEVSGLELNINTLASYERNNREPKIDMIIRLARYFGVTADYLLGMSEHKTVENEAVSKTIPLSDEAIIQLRRITKNSEATQNINSVLESGKAEKYFKIIAELIKE